MDWPTFRWRWVAMKQFLYSITGYSYYRKQFLYSITGYSYYSVVYSGCSTGLYKDSRTPITLILELTSMTVISIWPFWLWPTRNTSICIVFLLCFGFFILPFLIICCVDFCILICQPLSRYVGPCPYWLFHRQLFIRCCFPSLGLPTRLIWSSTFTKNICMSYPFIIYIVLLSSYI